jgi:hypothetical protein
VVLDNGEGSERYVGTLRGRDVSRAPLDLVRVDLANAEVTLTEICGLRTASSRIHRWSTKVAESSWVATAAMACSPRSTSPPTAARRCDGGASRTMRADSGSALQSVVFPAAGFGRDFYYCSFATVARVAFRS